jgi:predicted nucleic acid-binding protein
MTFLDTGILVGALLEKHPEHEQCLSAFDQYRDSFTDAHALAETFSTLTGFYKVPTTAAAEMILSLKTTIQVEALALTDYEAAIGQAHSRGIMGGGIYDSLHATFARRKGAKRIVTRNPSNFQHAAGDIEILTP